MQEASSKQQTKLQTQSSVDRITTSLSLGKQRKNKQTNKNSAQITPYTKLTQTTGPTLGGQKPKGRKNSTFFKERIQLSLKPGKRRLQKQSLKKMRRQRNTAQMKEQTRNTEVKINEKEIGKLHEKNSE